MKIKVQKSDYETVANLPRPKHLWPLKPNMFFRTLLKVASIPDLKATNFSYEMVGMHKLGKKEPCLILMNHSSFIDLEICCKVFYPRPFNIVCTSDGFVGKERLMRKIGCIPTQKFVMDVTLLRDMKYSLEHLNCSILMFPEASYSFDGTATPLPLSVGKCIKMLKVPVVMVKTNGAFIRDPLYNNLQKRKVDVGATITYLLSPEEIQEKSASEINAILKEQFSFDNFKWQQDNGIQVKESFRADYLNRVLYKCPHCLEEGKMKGQHTQIFCQNCGVSYELTENGFLHAPNGKFNHVPDWYSWERACVEKEIEEGTYQLHLPVDIYMMVDRKCIYQVGEGELIHNSDGFHLTGCDGKLDYFQKSELSYSLYADYYWYEIGDMICIGNQDTLYYCFPKVQGDYVAKTRLATEEIYRFMKSRRARG